MITNTTRNSVIAHNVRVLKSSFDQARGLMFKILPLDTAYVFPYSWPRKERVIMPFVKQPLDLIFLDKAGRVLEIRENLMPWKIHSASEIADMLIELHAGSINESKTEIGDHIIITTENTKKDI